MLEDSDGYFFKFTGHEEKGRCFWCGEPLSGRKRRYCSKQHAYLYLTFFHWPEACTNVYRRIYDPYRGYVCEICEDAFVGDSIQIHHIIPLNGEDRGWNDKNRPENLLGLCKDCHRETHRALFEMQAEEKRKQELLIRQIQREYELQIQPELF